ncbi:MAG: DNA-binding protein [Gammaproteobacteria bacterium]|nr:MAG: DNA-binding protein [Gammaproteobacteria bacterium]
MQTASDKFQSIEKITLATVPTEQAAFYLNRRPQTLRIWAMKESGLIRPIRINKRLAWPVKEIKKVLGIECQ